MQPEKKSLRASEQDRPDVAQKRREWIADLPRLDPARLIFIDESGAKTNMTRLYGRTFGGGRVVDKAPSGHWTNTTIISALRLDGSTVDWVLEGATDTEVFHAYVQQALVYQHCDPARSW